MNRWREIASPYWQARTLRERYILMAGALLLILVLFWLLILTPALEARTAWKKNLPTLRAQQTQMQSLLAEVKAAPPAAAKKITPLSRQFINSSLADQGLKPDNFSLNGEHLTLTLTNIKFSSLIVWLQEMQRSAQLRVAEAKVTAQPQADYVDVTLSLRQTH